MIASELIKLTRSEVRLCFVGVTTHSHTHLSTMDFEFMFLHERVTFDASLLRTERKISVTKVGNVTLIMKNRFKFNQLGPIQLCLFICLE